jgi:hypothetical protein
MLLRDEDPLFGKPMLVEAAPILAKTESLDQPVPPFSSNDVSLVAQRSPVLFRMFLGAKMRNIDSGLPLRHTPEQKFGFESYPSPTYFRVFSSLRGRNGPSSM